MSGFLYKTIRAQWVLQEHTGISIVEHGPYPSDTEAEVIQRQFQKDRPLSNFRVVYLETVVDVEPVIQEVIEEIATEAEGLLNLMVQKKKSRRNAAYIHEGLIQKTLSAFADRVRNKVQTGLENPNA